VSIADPVADPAEVEREHGMKPIVPDGERFELVVGAVTHDAYRRFPDETLVGLVAPGGTLADLKGMWSDRALDPALDRWTL
jgi:UDP-N-acetyl-D-galactosamine dehydrogenase